MLHEWLLRLLLLHEWLLRLLLLHEWLLRLLGLIRNNRGPMLIDWLRRLFGHLKLLLRRYRLMVWLLCLPIRLDSNEDFGIAFIVTCPKLNTSGRWVAHEIGT